MDGQANSADVDLDAMTRGESYAPETGVAHSLDGDAGDDAQDGEDHEGEEVADDDDSQ